MVWYRILRVNTAALKTRQHLLKKVLPQSMPAMSNAVCLLQTEPKLTVMTVDRFHRRQAGHGQVHWVAGPTRWIRLWDPLKHTLHALILRHNPLKHTLHALILQHDPLKHTVHALILRHNPLKHTLHALILQHNPLKHTSCSHLTAQPSETHTSCSHLTAQPSETHTSCSHLTA